MSIRISSGVNGLLSLPGLLDGSAKPITFCFFAKVDSFPTSSSNTVHVIKSIGGSGFISARIVQSSSTRLFNASSNDGGYNSATYDLATNAAGAWRGCVATFTSNSRRDVYVRTNTDEGGLLTASNTSGNNTSGETGLELLNGTWPSSIARYSHLTVYEGTLTPLQADEFILTGTVVGLTPLHQWLTTTDWGVGNIDNSGSSGIDITPPVAWTYDTDTPNFNIGPNTTPTLVSTSLYEFQYQINATDLDGTVLSYSVSTPAAHGTASVNGTGLVTYTPNGTFTNTDTFVISANDGITSALSTILVSSAIVSNVLVIDFSSFLANNESPIYDSLYQLGNRP